MKVVSGGIVSGLLKDVELPRMFRARQTLMSMANYYVNNRNNEEVD